MSALWPRLICLWACVVYATAAAPVAGRQPSTVSIIVALHHAPVSVLRSTFRSLEEIAASNNQVQVLVSPVGSLDPLKRDALESLIGADSDMKHVHFVESDIEGETTPACLNRLAKEAKGEFIFFLSEFAQLKSYESLQELIDTLSIQRDSTAVVTNKIIYEDGSLFAAGVEFVSARNPNKQSVPAWSDYGGSSWRSSSKSGRYSSWRNRGRHNSVVDADDDTPEPAKSAPVIEYHKSKSDVPVLFYRLQGHSSLDSRADKPTEVLAASIVSFAIKKDLLAEMHFFNDTAFDFSYFDADLCLRLKHQRGLNTLYVPSSVTILSTIGSDYDSDSDWAPDNLYSERGRSSLASFTDLWYPELQAQLDAQLHVKNLTLVWNMDCGAGQVLGFTTEAINILIPLDKQVRIKVVVANSEECRSDLRRIGFPLSTRKLLRIMEDREDRVAGEHIVAVLHKDPGRYSFSLFQEPFRSASYVAGRSMFETTRIPAGWVQPCADVDAIWVPSQFNVETFSISGINSSKLVVIPEAIDLNHFDPSIHKPLRTLKRDNTFRFLTVSKWEKRKAWQSLLKAYFEEFSSGVDSVVLTIRSNMNAEGQKQYHDFVDDFTASKNISKTDLPKVELVTTLLPYSKLPSLYKSADAFVLASHGEGWGLPLMEAMSMKLPTIATNWSGNTAFMTAENSFLVEVEKMVPVPDGENGHLWADPSISSLKKQLRDVYQHSSVAKTRGETARASLVREFNSKSGEAILSQLLHIQPDLAELKAARDARASQNTWGGSYQYGSTTGSNNNAGWSNSWSGNSQQTFEDAQGNTRVRIKINP